MVKNPINSHNVYHAVAKAVFILHARAYAGDARNASFERMERPFFPADDDIPLQPTILQ